MVAGCLKPGGRVLIIDSARTERSTAADHQLPSDDEDTMTRRLDDGREFQIIKRFYDPAGLTQALRELGWHADVAATPEFFIYGTATPQPQG
jgi:demethylmenaquinone methyltransferase/2-methoxy-6-polyprenyl-1,4-benzoquinol methylase